MPSWDSEPPFQAAAGLRQGLGAVPGPLCVVPWWCFTGASLGWSCQTEGIWMYLEYSGIICVSGVSTWNFWAPSLLQWGPNLCPRDLLVWMVLQGPFPDPGLLLELRRYWLRGSCYHLRFSDGNGRSGQVWRIPFDCGGKVTHGPKIRWSVCVA